MKKRFTIFEQKNGALGSNRLFRIVKKFQTDLFGNLEIGKFLIKVESAKLEIFFLAWEAFQLRLNLFNFNCTFQLSNMSALVRYLDCLVQGVIRTRFIPLT